MKLESYCAEGTHAPSMWWCSMESTDIDGMSKRVVLVILILTF